MLVCQKFQKCLQSYIAFFLNGLDENGFLVYNIIVYSYVHTLLSALYPHNANYVEGSNGP